ncbi:hypothetical protein EST38_g4331 [Candolleomyces aberdarensis]|uniref:Protein kinase domain-containing protein n=1 Tax=Candolleomyces aberdarensis TaxID=2316362 RepID=A0A4Q2DRA3_9AGAR|nr:hypothetical protein EST38_g4331 [Candolleomyces aberdarensis]
MLSMTEINERAERFYPLCSPWQAVNEYDDLVAVVRKVWYEGNIYIDQVPVALFSPILARLQQQLQDRVLLDQVAASPDQLKNTFGFVNGATKLVDTQEDRLTAVRGQLEQLLAGSTTQGQKPTWAERISWTPYSKPTAIWWSDDHGKGFPTLILELTAVPGLNGDPLHKAVVDYATIVLHEKHHKNREVTNFPTILLGIAGSQLRAAAAICVGSSIYISTLISFNAAAPIGFHSTSDTLTLARVFQSLFEFRLQLEAYDRSITTSNTRGDIELRDRFSGSLFPIPTPVHSGVILPGLTYRGFLSSKTGQTTHSLVNLGKETTAKYVATLNDGTEVVVKFTASYNSAAHRLLSDSGLAPRLYFCERVMGDLAMVVMERVRNCVPLAYLLNHGPEGTGSGVDFVVKKVEEAVRLLHEREIVFGNLREENILCVAASKSSVASVLLVDFDWAAKDGEGRYPAALNDSGKSDSDEKTTGDCQWAEGAEPFGVMKKAHDVWQVERLKKMINDSVTI